MKILLFLNRLKKGSETSYSDTIHDQGWNKSAQGIHNTNKNEALHTEKGQPQII